MNIGQTMSGSWNQISWRSHRSQITFAEERPFHAAANAIFSRRKGRFTYMHV